MPSLMIKKQRSVVMGLTGLLLAASLSGCGQQGLDQVQETTQEYLISVENQEVQQPVTNYVTTTITRQDYIATFANNANRYYEMSPVMVDWQWGSLKLLDYYIEDGMYVEEGTVLATFTPRYDELEKEENRIAYTRSQEAYDRFVKEQTEKLAKELEKVEALPAESEAWEEAMENYTLMVERYEEEKLQKEEALAEMKVLMDAYGFEGQTIEIKAHTSGYVYYNSRSHYQSRRSLYHEAILCEIYQKEGDYYTLDDDMNLMSWGQKVELTYEDEQGGSTAFYGTVVSADNVLPSDMQRKLVLIKAEKPEGMDVLPDRVMAKVQVMSMANVLVVSTNAIVKTPNGSYVTVVTEKGLERHYVDVIYERSGQSIISNEHLEGAKVIVQSRGSESRWIQTDTLFEMQICREGGCYAAFFVSKADA